MCWLNIDSLAGPTQWISFTERINQQVTAGGQQRALLFSTDPSHKLIMLKTFPAGKVKAAASLAVLAGMVSFNGLLITAPFSKVLLQSLWGLLHPCPSALPPLASGWEEVSSWRVRG